MSAQKSDISCNLCRFPVYRWTGTGEGPARDVARDVGHRTDVDRSEQFYDGAREVPCGARAAIFFFVLQHLPATPISAVE